ncbi:hypothetical protein [Sphingobacterium sp. BIGb0165]|uniref:hypothetical protein n=1 Tax=Sphingobacterium sp. BIGb0165 TaxID=2940615 RepID=UPI0021687A24|nr:hypothetical protein [Sphingobacterium sp. BIGb0165]MCS4226029.1 hypothetical protein [Sphingobacterium sp. BIGb0165]
MENESNGSIDRNHGRYGVMIKKSVVIILAVMTILICGWLILGLVSSLDIPSNKNDQFASEQKWRVDQRSDIDSCEKQIIKNQIDLKRANERQISGRAFQTQILALLIIVLQLILIVFVILIRRKPYS